MKTQKVFLLAALLATFVFPQSVMAYDFSAASPSGHTLYYNILNGYAEVTFEHFNSGYPSPTYASVSGRIVIPDTVSYNGTTFTVVSIGSNAFWGSSSITSVVIPNTVSTIAGCAFSGCSGLTSVTIPKSVTFIAGGAFSACSGVTEITCLAEVAPTLGQTNVFTSMPRTVPVYIPCASRASYVSLWNRERFSNFVETFLFTLDAQSADTTMGSVVITTQPTCSDSTAVVTATANSGYLFDHWSDGTTINPYTFTVTSDTTIIAYFVREEGPEGITDVNNENISAYVHDGHIVVTGAEGESVQVFDITGRPVNGHSQLPTGVYMVKVGTLPIRKVVVIK